MPELTLQSKYTIHHHPTFQEKGCSGISRLDSGSKTWSDKVSKCVRSLKGAKGQNGFLRFMIFSRISQSSLTLKKVHFACLLLFQMKIIGYWAYGTNIPKY